MTDTADSSKYASDMVVGIVGKAIGLVGGYGTLWLLTDILSQEGYGGYTGAFAVISLLALFAQMGLRQATIQRVSELSVEDEAAVPRHAGAAVSYVAIASLVITSVALAATLVLDRVFDPLMVWFIRLLALVIPGMALLAVCDGVLRGLERVSAGIALRQIFVQILRLSGLLIVWVFWQDPIAVVLAIGVSFYVPLITFGLRTRGWGYLNLSSMSWSHMQFSGYLLGNSIAGKFLKEADILLLAILGTLTATGSYNVAWKIAIVTRYVDSILTNTLQPRLSKYLAAGDMNELYKEFNQVRDLSVAGGLPVLVIIALFGESLLSIFGDYTNQYPVLLILAAGGIMNSSFGTIGQVLIMGKKARLALLNTSISIGGNLILNFLLIPRYSTAGAATATVFTVYFLTNVVATIEVKIYMGINLVNIKTITVVFIPIVAVFAKISGLPITKYSIAVLSVLSSFFFLAYHRKFIKTQFRELLGLTS